MKRKILLIGFIVLTSVQFVFAGVEEYAVQVSVEVQENPPKFTFSWSYDPTAEHYYVYRKAKTDTVWGNPIAVLNGSATVFEDNNVIIGEGYEYGFYKSLNFFQDTVYAAHGSDLTFKIFDSWGDGISPNHGLGWYKVSGNVFDYAQGDSFGYQEFTSFTVDAGDTSFVDRIVISLQLDIYGEETTWELIEDSTGAVLASGGPYLSPKFGHIFAGIKYPYTDCRGTVLLIVDDTYSNDLTYELQRLEVDIICDGWRVRRYDVSRNDDVTVIKNLIINEYQSDPNIVSVFLFGHIAVPYSGNVMSSHPDHRGAWSADLYYVELDGVWTDTFVNNTTATRPANHNVPGDGKFDQTFIESDVDLQLGRVDLYDLPTFTESDIELMRRYLDKNHNFRYGIINAERRGLIDDNLGVFWGTAVAGIGMRNFSAMFGTSNVHDLDYFSTMGTESYLWSQGCGGGTYNSCGGVGSTYDFATRTVKSVFTMLYGSYFGDWDNTDNFLRAPLASENSVLVCFWAGAPTWHLHHMALGETIGYSTMLSQNNISLYAPANFSRQIHVALMGDPTLRMHTVFPSYSLQANLFNNDMVKLQWTSSMDTISGYHIYRSATLYDSFSRLTISSVNDTFFVDSFPLNGNNVYMVRAVKLENTGSGTYYNLSQGILDSIDINATYINEDHRIENNFNYYLKQNYPNPFNASTVIEYQLLQTEYISLAIYDLSGRLVRTLVDEEKQAGVHYALWDGRDDMEVMTNSGIYFYRMRTGSGYAKLKRMIYIK